MTAGYKDQINPEEMSQKVSPSRLRITFVVENETEVQNIRADVL